MTWWRPVAQKLQRQLNRDPRVRQAVSQAQQQFRQAVKSGDAAKWAKQAQNSAVQGARNVSAQVRSMTASLNEALGHKPGSGNAGKSSGANNAGSSYSSSSSSSSNSGSNNSSGNANNSGGSSGAKASQWFDELKEKFASEEFRTRVIQFLMANFMGVIFFFQFGHQLVTLIWGAWTTVREQRHIKHQSEAKEKKRQQREEETRSLTQQQEDDRVAAEERRKNEYEALQRKHGGHADMFVDTSSYKTQEGSTGAAAQLEAMSPAPEDQPMSRRQRKKLERQQQQQMRQSEPDYSEELMMLGGKPQIRQKNNNVAPAHPAAIAAAQAGGDKKSNNTEHYSFATGSAFAYRIGSENGAMVSATAQTQNDPNYYFNTTRYDAATGGASYDPLAWDKRGSWGRGEAHSHKNLDPLARW